MSTSDLPHQSADLPVIHDGVIHKTMASRPQQIADIMANLTWSVHDEDELMEYLQRCADLAVRVVGGAHCAGVTAHLHGDPFTAVCTDVVTLVVDSNQYVAGDGPCLHAMRSGEIVMADVATSRERWPAFTADAEEAGIHSFLAAPLGQGAERFGALNLYSHDVDGFTEDDAVLLQLLVEHATRAVQDLTHARSAEALTAQLREAMISRAPIEQAKGILMAAHRIDADAAFDLLRSRSQNSNTKLHDVAATFVAEHSGRPDPTRA